MLDSNSHPAPYQCATSLATALQVIGSAHVCRHRLGIPPVAKIWPPVMERACRQFHRRCGDTVMLSEGRRATSAPCDCPAFSPHQTAFSNAHILKGQVFSVKVSPEGEGHASPVIQKCTCNSFKRLAVCSVCPSWIAHTREQSEHKSS